MCAVVMDAIKIETLKSDVRTKEEKSGGESILLFVSPRHSIAVLQSTPNC